MTDDMSEECLFLCVKEELYLVSFVSSFSAADANRSARRDPGPVLMLISGCPAIRTSANWKTGNPDNPCCCHTLRTWYS